MHAVSKEGSKIRIKYDDSTSEISKFPDKDVVIDDFHNGEHQANAAKFIPPEPKPSMDEDDEEDFTQQPKPKPAPVERKPSPVEKEENPADDVKKELKAAEEPKPPVGTTVEEKPPRRSPVEPSIPSHPDDDVPPPSSEDYHVRPSSPPIEGVAYVTAASSKPPSSTTQENKEPTLKYRTPTPITDSSTSQENKRPTLKSRTPTPPTQESSEKNVITDKAVTEATEAFKSAPSEEKAKEDEPAVSSEAIVEPPPKKAESTVPEQQPAERPKPTLKIRLVNPNRDRPGSAQQPKPQSSPRMKPIKKTVVDSSDEDESPTEETSRSKSAEPEQTAEKESLKKNKEIAADDTLASKKRKAEESPSEAVTVAGPPTKRIHIRCPTEKQEGKCQDAPVEYPKERPTEAKYKEPPSSGRTDDFKSKTSHQDIKPKKVVDPDTTKQISDDFKEKVTQEDTKPTKAAQPEAGTRDDDLDIDDGPVKISARNSGKRLPLFSDEEDEPPSVSEKPSNEAVTAEDKPKKVDEQRKEEEAKPHRPLAKIASSEHTPVEPAKTTEAFRGDKAVVKKSENSAFERKDSKTKETHKEVSTQAKSTNAAAKSPGPSAGLAKKLPRRPSTPHDKSELSTAAVRSGRKAAQQAHERIVSKPEGGEKEKDKDKETTTAPSKKRKKRREGDDDSDQGSNEDHNNWIQCDSCKKWRIIPNHIKISSLPEKWYCHLNVYDPKRNTCEAPEESTAPIPSRKRKRGRKRIRQRAEEAAHAAEPTLSRKDSSQSDSGKERSRARNPVPKEEVKPKEAELVKTNSTPKPARSSPSSMSPGEKNLPETGSEFLAKPEKKISGGRKRLPDAPLESIPEAPIAEQQKAKRGRGRRKEYREEQNQGTGGSVASSGKQDNDLDNVEWVQCEKW
mgnify:CR=1 FL=1